MANPVLKLGSKSPDVVRLQRALNAVYASWSTVTPLATDGDFGPSTEARVKKFQIGYSLIADGVVGAQTWSMLLSKVPAEMPAPESAPAPSSDALEAAGRAAIARALEIWAADIIDPPVGMKGERAARSLKFINEMLRTTEWDWVGYYDGNGHKPEWCGLFAAYCWLAAGLEGEWPEHFWASNLRLLYWINYRPWNGVSADKRPATGGRMKLDTSRATQLEDLVFPDGTAPRAGDVVIVGDGTPFEGDHVTMLVSMEALPDGRVCFHTVSGNGGGYGPDGRRREGVVKTDYFLDPSGGYRVLHVYRPGADDIVAR